MAEIDGGALSFKSVMDNDQINTAIEETLRRVQGLSDGTVSGGKKMDAAFDATADSIRSALGQIGTACEMHEKELQNLESEYQRLGQKASAAFMAGRDEEYSAITNQQNAIKGEITVRERLLQELRDQSNELEKIAQKQDESRQKTEENANAQISMRSRIKSLREEMMLLVDQGIDEQSEAYQRLKNELGRLIDIQGDVAQQGRTLANDEQKFQGIITGLSGLAGGFSAVTGAVGLFAGENEDLNKVMTKVQSVMAITIGLQQVAQTLNKDSAFSLVTLNGLKKWWADVVAKSTVAETAETIATNANTAAQNAQAAATAKNTTTEAVNTVATGAQATAATAGTVANIGLAGAFRLVGTAIKSIPVFGWILAGISALIGLYVAFSSKARDAKKAQEEFSKSMIEGCYKPIGTIEELSTKYTALGNNMKAKEKFIQDNKKSFDDLGVSVVGVRDAENLLIANKDRFILAQIAKAKAMVYTQQATEKIKKLMELQAEADAMPDKSTTYVQTGSGQFGGNTGYYVTGENVAKQNKEKEIADLTKEIKSGYNNAYIEEKNAAYNLKKGGIGAINDYSNGTVGAIEQAISRKQDALKRLKPNSKEWKQTYDDIAKLQKQIAAPSTGGTTRNTGGSSSDKDPFLTKLEAYKKEYDRFKKWVNSGDSVLTKAASTEFKGLLAQGASYIDYLKKQREIIESVDISSRTKAQNAQLRTLNNQIAEETKKTVLESFNIELSEQLNNAKSVMQMLAIIEQKRKDLKNDGTDLDNGKKETLDDAEKDVSEKAKEELEALLEKYRDYEEQRTAINKKYDYERKRIEESGKSQEELSKKLKVLEDSRKASILAVNDAEIEETKKSTDLFVHLFEDASTKSVNEIRRIIVEAENLYAYLQEQDGATKPIGFTDEQLATLKKSPAELKAIQEAIRKLKADVSGKSPFTKFYDDISDAITKIKKGGTENIGQGMVDIGSAAQSIMPTVEKFGQDLGAIFGDDMADDINVITDLLGATVEVGMGVGKIMSGDVVGGITDVVSGLSKVFSMASEAEKRHQEALKAIANEKIAFQREYNLLLIQQNELLKKAETIFGVDAYGKAVGYIQQMEQSIFALNAELAGTSAQVAKFSSRRLFGGFTRELTSAQNKFKQAYAGLADVEIKTGHKKTGLFGWGKGKDIYSSVLDVYPELIKANGEFDAVLAETIMKTRTMSDEDKAAFQGIIDLSKMASEALAAVKDYLTGIFGELGTTMSDALVDAFKNGTDAAEKFTESVTKMLENLAEQMIYSVTLAPIMEKAQEQMLSIMKNPGLSNEQKFNSYVGILDNLMNDAISEQNSYNQLLEKYKEIASGRGLDLWAKESENQTNTALSGSYKTVSEETASMVGGQMNAMRINQMEATAILRQQLMQLATIAQNTSYNKNLVDIRNDIRDMKNAQSGTSLRSQGLS